MKNVKTKKFSAWTKAFLPENEFNIYLGKLENPSPDSKGSLGDTGVDKGPILVDVVAQGGH